MGDARLRVGIDTGGTFTDIAVVHDGKLDIHKLPSTPDDPARAVLAGIQWARDHSIGTGSTLDVVHGTTVGLNAILTRTFARTGWITSAGTRDLVEIGRQDRLGIYDLEPRKPAFPIPRQLRFELPDRRRADGERIQRPTREQLAQLRDKLAAAGVESIAIGLLHAYAHPGDELRIARALRGLGIPISCSGDLLPTIGEYERFVATALNAAITPLMGEYLHRLALAIEGPGRLRLMRSSGGIMSTDEARVAPARAVFSGPAGGVSAAARLAEAIEAPLVATLDMGGTSTDVALVRATRTKAGADQTETDLDTGPIRTATVAGLPLPLPALDLHTIGCGGGSIASVDVGGALRVGPESAGAAPGPACYGVGERPTVTDAHVVLGHIGSTTLLGGEFVIDPDRSARAIDAIARRLRLSRDRCAAGILEVAETAMLRALLVISVERNIDPGSLPLVAFGGAGGLHAASLARKLGMPAAFIPTAPGAFSAVGLALAGESTEVTIPILRELRSIDRSELATLAREAKQRAMVGIGPSARATSRLRVRFFGQGEGLWVRGTSLRAIERQFRQQHERQFGFWPGDGRLECVELAATAETPGSPLPDPAPRAGRSTGHGPRPPRADATRRGFSVYHRGGLPVGTRLAGPALIEETTAVTVIPVGATVDVAAIGLHISPRDSS